MNEQKIKSLFRTGEWGSSLVEKYLEMADPSQLRKKPNTGLNNLKKTQEKNPYLAPLAICLYYNYVRVCIGHNQVSGNTRSPIGSTGPRSDCLTL